MKKILEVLFVNIDNLKWKIIILPISIVLSPLGLKFLSINREAIDIKKVKALLKGYIKEIQLSPLEVDALKKFTFYTGAAMTFWRHLNFNYTEPTPGLFDHYKGLKVITDYVGALPSDCFHKVIEEATD
jgi:Ser/Thr protein kinase RdoA (MazF antagonist)